LRINPGQTVNKTLDRAQYRIKRSFLIVEDAEEIGADRPDTGDHDKQEQGVPQQIWQVHFLISYQLKRILRRRVQVQHIGACQSGIRHYLQQELCPAIGQQRSKCFELDGPNLSD